MKTQSITKENLLRLYQVACPKYKELIDEYGKQYWKSEHILIKENDIRVAYGYAKDEQKALMEEMFDLKPEVARAWEELSEIKGFYIEADSVITDFDTVLPDQYDKNTFATEKQAKAALAMAQLSQLMKQVNGDWVPDLVKAIDSLYVIKRVGNSLQKDWFRESYYFLAFRTAEIRDQFLKNHEQLIKEYYEI